MSRRFIVERTKDGLIRRREETPEEREARRAERRGIIQNMLNALRALAGGIRAFRRKDPEDHFARHPLDVPHPAGKLRVRLDDKSKDLPVKSRPVLGGPERRYAFAWAGYGEGARVRREREGRRFEKARTP